MKALVGIVLGLFSGILIYIGAAMVVAREGGGPSPGFVAATLIGGWVVSSWLLVRGARSVSKVFSRGFLLGAAEWLAMIPAGMILSGKALSATVEKGSGSDAEVAGATIGAGLVSAITGGVSVVMALVCLLGFLVSHLLGREMKPEATAATRACPECAELVQLAARRCKHCGAEIAPAA